MFSAPSEKRLFALKHQLMVTNKKHNIVNTTVLLSGFPCRPQGSKFVICLKCKPLLVDGLTCSSVKLKPCEDLLTL